MSFPLNIQQYFGSIMQQTHKKMENPPFLGLCTPAKGEFYSMGYPMAYSDQSSGPRPKPPPGCGICDPERWPWSPFLSYFSWHPVFTIVICDYRHIQPFFVFYIGFGTPVNCWILPEFQFFLWNRHFPFWCRRRSSRRSRLQRPWFGGKCYIFQFWHSPERKIEKRKWFFCLLFMELAWWYWLFVFLGFWNPIFPKFRPRGSHASVLSFISRQNPRFWPHFWLFDPTFQHISPKLTYKPRKPADFPQFYTHSQANLP